MTPEGVARLFSLGLLVEGPFPEHYEPFETPLAENPLHPGQKNAISNPAARVFKGDMESFGKADKFPYAATTYRLTEHFHYWTKNVESNAITPALAVRRDRRGAGQGEGHRQRRAWSGSRATAARSRPRRW